MILNIIKTINSVLLWYVCFAMFFLWLYHKWAKTPVVITLLRFISFMACLATILLALITVTVYGLNIIIILFNYSEYSFKEIFLGIMVFFLQICLTLICIFIFWKAWWYYTITNKKTILTHWYMKRYFSIKKNKDNIKQAYEYLQKASEYKTDSVFIWSMMAMINEHEFERPEFTDKLLENARQVLNALDNPSPQDRAVFESATGEILLCRDNVEEGLAHLKAGCDLDPTDFNKKHYESALKWAAERDESEDSADTKEIGKDSC